MSEHYEQEFEGQLPYERISDVVKLCESFALRQGEHLLVRKAFRWHLDGKAIPNCYEMFDRDGICKERGWTVVHTFGSHIAVVRNHSGV